MRWIHFFLFGNYFYGICVIALSIEASLQQSFPLNDSLYYLAAFSVTVLYYTLAYVSEKAVDESNKRAVWYVANYRLVRITQFILIAFLLSYVVFFLSRHFAHLLHLSITEWILILIFPFSGVLYYGLASKWMGKLNLRSIGWLKPFIIGFTWAGLVTIYPIVVYCIQHGLSYIISDISLWLFVKNFMFITVLAILFDIKDYAVDHNQQLKTFVVHNGLRRTIFSIILPLCFTGVISFIYYAVTHNFSEGRILLNLIPFICLMIVAYSMHRRQSILYYLLIIDGLMLLKAVCGSAGMMYF